MADAVRDLDFLTIGSFPSGLIEELMARVSREVAGACRLVRSDPAIDVPGIEGRDQADADALLRIIEERAASGRVAVGLTSLDIGHPIFTFFFGRARLNGDAALVSLARLAPAFYGLPDDSDLLQRRAVREIVHELGHVGGLQHCDSYECIMHFAHNVETIDLRGAGFCRRCAAALAPGLF